MLKTRPSQIKATNKWRKENKESYREYQREYQRENYERIYKGRSEQFKKYYLYKKQVKLLCSILLD